MTDAYVVNGVDLTKPFSMAITVDLSNGHRARVWRPAAVVPKHVAKEGCWTDYPKAICVACDGEMRVELPNWLVLRQDAADQYETPRFWCGFSMLQPTVLGPVCERQIPP